MTYKTILARINNPIPIKNKYLRIGVNQIVLPLFILALLFFTPRVILDKYPITNKISCYSKLNIQDNITNIPIILKKNSIEINSSLNIYIPQSKTKYNQITLGRKKGTLGLNFSLINTILINPELPKTRRIENIIIHEIGHVYLEERFGLSTMLKFPTWKEEGFCEYLSNSSTMEIKKAHQIFMNKDEESKLLNSNTGKSGIYKYYTYRLLFDYLVNVKKMTIESIFMEEIDTDALKKEIRMNNYYPQQSGIAHRAV